MEGSASLGRWIKQRRKALDLTQDELARRVGCATVTLQKIEADERRPSRQIAERLANQLELTPEDRASFLRSARGELAADRLHEPAISTPPPISSARPEHLLSALPTGTVTFLFTDIEGSAALWEQHPEAARAALVQHDALVEQIVARHAGHIVRPRGEADSRFAVFKHAMEAVAAAAALQGALHAEPWRTSEPLRARIALHTGEADIRAGNYYSATINRCARLRTAAHGGQTLVSLATQALVRDALPDGLELRDLGEHRLKDLRRSEHIFQLVMHDLPADFPPIQTLDRRLHNLPVQRDPLLGREREVAEIVALLRRPAVGLVTLTGPGGTGKTRLSLQVAAELLGDFNDGVWFVDLAPISDPALVSMAVAQTLDIQEQRTRPLRETLTTHLHGQQLLLVLDNFEQNVAAAPLLTDLLAAAPGLKLLVTSREVLRLSGEQQYGVPPLALPSLERHEPPARLTQYPAVALFVRRAQAVKPDFCLTDENAQAVAAICVRLDGLPLALELAAARVKLFPPQALLARLQHRLTLLTGGARDRTARQQTLRGAIDWSVTLLDAEEQVLFTRLSIFVGGFTLEAAEAVCGADGILRRSVVDGLAALVDKSLVRQHDDSTGEPSFNLLETIHEYARERLEASGEAEAIQQRHAGYYLALVEAAEAELEGGEQVAWLQRLTVEHDNLRAAFTWSCRTPGTTELSLRFAGALYGFWFRHNHLTEARAWLERALAQPGGSPAARTKALFSLAQIADHLDELEWAMALFEESVALFRELGDRIGIARVLLNQGRILYVQGDYEHARRLEEESLIHFQELGDRAGVGVVLLSLGDVALDQGDLDAARTYFNRARRDSQELGLIARTAGATLSLSRVAHAAGDAAEASRLLDEGLALFRSLGDQMYAGGALLGTAWHVYEQGDGRRATRLFRESLSLLRDVGTNAHRSECLSGLAAASAATGQWVRAARLCGAADATRPALSHALPRNSQAQYRHDLAAARTALGEPAWTAAWSEGGEMSLEQGITFALEEIRLPEHDEQLPVPAVPDLIPTVLFPAGLTEREVDVLRRVARGLTDAEIAHELIISRHTVNAHLRTIYGKLGVSSRSAATRFAVEHHLV